MIQSQHNVCLFYFFELIQMGGGGGVKRKQCFLSFPEANRALTNEVAGRVKTRVKGEPPLIFSCLQWLRLQKSHAPYFLANAAPRGVSRPARRVSTATPQSFSADASGPRADGRPPSWLTRPAHGHSILVNCSWSDGALQPETFAFKPRPLLVDRSRWFFVILNIFFFRTHFLFVQRSLKLRFRIVSWIWENITFVEKNQIVGSGNWFALYLMNIGDICSFWSSGELVPLRVQSSVKPRVQPGFVKTEML